jgi:hypothetical protein
MLTAFSTLSGAHRAVLGALTIARQNTVAVLDGLIHREHGAAVTVPGNESRDLEFFPAWPGYLCSIIAGASLPDGFELQITTNEGRLFSAPMHSDFFAVTEVDGVRLPGHTLTEPRLCSGAARVRVRNLAAVPQVLRLALHTAELAVVGAVPEVVQREFDLLSGGVFFGAPEAGVASRAAAFDAGGGAGDMPAVLGADVSVAVLNGVVELLPASSAGSTQVWSVLLFLDGEYSDVPVTAYLGARSAGGAVRRLHGEFRGLGGGKIEFQIRARPWWTLVPGEALVLVCDAPLAVTAARWGGLIEHFAV